MWSSFETSNGLVGWSSGDGAPLCVILHGGPGLTDYTESLADELRSALPSDATIVRYQQRGQVPSTTSGPFTVAQFVADAIEVIDHFDADKALVVGHSWGGHLALHVGCSHPQRVLGLLLVDALGGVGDGGHGAMAAIISERIGPDALASIDDLDDPDAVMRSTKELRILWPGYFADPLAAPPMPSDVRYDDDLNAAVMVDANRLLAEGDLERRMPTTSVRSVHVIGTASPIDPEANRITARLLDGEVVMVDTGHFPWLESPGCVAIALARLDLGTT
ncbi:MAG TPA: alpha/beta hydrolase [Acidimicrobiales bacterium]|nr:alpha/beta hydrolase [Acidimicrobiales bacterium]